MYKAIEEYIESENNKGNFLSLVDFVKYNKDELRSVKQTLKENESIKNTMSVFNYSEKHGGFVDSHRYYNDYYVYVN